jgi:hypothetical protein
MIALAANKLFMRSKFTNNAFLNFYLMKFNLLTLSIEAHRGGQGGGGYETAPPRQIFKKLVNKNVIKCKIGGPPWQFFLKPLTPPWDFGKNFKYPPPPGPHWIFNPCASMTLSQI